jgi:hypothetical protein
MLVSSSAARFLKPYPVVSALLFVFVILRSGIIGIDFPYWDDYNSVLEFLLKFRNSDIYNKFQLLFSQHNEHRLLWNRILVLTDAYIFGSVHFGRLIFYGNLGWIFTWFLLRPELKRASVPILMFCAVLFLSLSFYETVFWATASMQNFWVIFWALAGFKTIRSNSSGVQLLGCAAIFLSTFTSVSGVLAVPVACLLLVFRNSFTFQNILICTILLCIPVLYFLEYNSPLHHLSLYENLFSDPLRSTAYFFRYLGSPLLIVCGYRDWFLIPAGVLVFISCLYALVKLRLSNLFLFSLILYTLLSVAALTAGRALMDAPGAIVSRYLVFPFFIWIVLLLSYREIFSKHRITFLHILGISFAICWLSIDYYRFWDAVSRDRDSRLNGQACLCTCQHPFALNFPHLPEAQRILNEASRVGIFLPCATVFSQCKAVEDVKNPEFLRWKIEKSELMGPNVRIYGWAFYPGADSRNNHVDLVIQTAQRYHTQMTVKRVEPLLGLLSGNEKNSYAGFETRIPLNLYTQIRKSYLQIQWCGGFMLTREIDLSKLN